MNIDSLNQYALVVASTPDAPKVLSGFFVVVVVFSDEESLSDSFCSFFLSLRCFSVIPHPVPSL